MGLFVYENGEPFIKPLKVNSHGKLLCEVDDCYNVVRNKGKNQGGLMRVCPAHYYGRKAHKGGYAQRNVTHPYCENIDGRLGFRCTCTIMDECMLTVDHIDNDHYNTDPADWQSLCAGCHNYKSKFYGRIYEGLAFMLELFERNRQRVREQETKAASEV